ncbi:MAG: phosphoribosylglycinamide formyltransferase [Christensenellales bacterium]|jgi:phosphoribosylglycinamide formyltransferase-1
MKHIAVFASGGGSNFQAVIDGCARGGIPGKVALLIYDRKSAFARVRAESAGIPAIYMHPKMFGSFQEHDEETLALLKEHAVDIIVLAGYLRILGEKTLAAYENAVINTHPALIPSFCGMGFYGLKVHQAALDYGVKVSGCTIHFVDAGVDSGPIIFQQAVNVLPGDTPEKLQQRILPVEHKLLTKAAKLLCQDRIRVYGRRVEII